MIDGFLMFHTDLFRVTYQILQLDKTYLRNTERFRSKVYFEYIFFDMPDISPIETRPLH